MSDQAAKLKEIVNGQQSKKGKKTRFIAITSGKGGVGKSTISANLAYMFSKHGIKVGLFDADLGLANLDVLLGVSATKNLLHVVKGECSLDESIIKLEENFFLIPGDSGAEILKYADPLFFERLLSTSSILDDLDVMVIDTGAGIGQNTQMFLNAADDVVVVAVPDPASITDAYAMIKINSGLRGEVGLFLNQVKSDKEAMMIFEKIAKVAEKNIGSHFHLAYMGKMSLDPVIAKSVRQRKLFAKEAAAAGVTKDLERLAKLLSQKMERNMLVEMKESGINGLFKRLLDQF